MLRWHAVGYTLREELLCFLFLHMIEISFINRSGSISKYLPFSSLRSYLGENTYKNGLWVRLKKKHPHTHKKKRPQKPEKFSHRPRKNVSAVNRSILTGISDDGFAQHL